MPDAMLYSHGCVILKIATDGIVLRGCYTTITLAVYGSLTSVVREATPPPPTAPTIQPARQPQPGNIDAHIAEDIFPIGDVSVWKQKGLSLTLVD